MKKLFLLIGIGAFTGVSAQQKDIFDIQGHLQKKLKQESKIASALPQQKVMPTLPFCGNRNKLSHILPNGDKVVMLPIDNMPCVQPDMKQFTVTPSLQPDIRQFRTMPNVSRIYTDAQFTFSPGTIPADKITEYFLQYK